MDNITQMDRLDGRPEPEFDGMLAILTRPAPGQPPVLRAVDATDPPTDSRKVFSTLRARAAIRGIVLIESTDERGRPEWIASLHALTKAFDSLAEVDGWLSRVEGTR